MGRRAPCDPAHPRGDRRDFPAVISDEARRCLERPLLRSLPLPWRCRRGAIRTAHRSNLVTGRRLARPPAMMWRSLLNRPRIRGRPGWATRHAGRMIAPRPQVPVCCRAPAVPCWKWRLFARTRWIARPATARPGRACERAAAPMPFLCISPSRDPWAPSASGIDRRDRRDRAAPRSATRVLEHQAVDAPSRIESLQSGSSPHPSHTCFPVDTTIAIPPGSAEGSTRSSPRATTEMVPVTWPCAASCLATAINCDAHSAHSASSTVAAVPSTCTRSVTSPESARAISAKAFRPAGLTSACRGVNRASVAISRTPLSRWDPGSGTSCAADRQPGHRFREQDAAHSIAGSPARRLRSIPQPAEEEAVVPPAIEVGSSVEPEAQSRSRPLRAIRPARESCLGRHARAAAACRCRSL